MAAYAGVFFLLLIFVLLNSALVFTPGVPIRLPDADELPGVAGDTLVVAMDASGQIYFENQLTTEGAFKQRLSEAVNATRRPLTLVVEADREVKWDALLQLSLLARKAGIRDVVPATRPGAKAKAVPHAP